MNLKLTLRKYGQLIQEAENVFKKLQRMEGNKKQYMKYIKKK